MTNQSSTVTVNIKYKDVEKTFSGSMEEVWLCTHKFFHDFIPSFETANKLMLKTDLRELAEDCKGVMAFSQEGPNILVSRDKLTDNEAITLWLLANHVGHQLGVLNDETASKEELQTRLGKTSKITSTRLGELVKAGTVTKVDDDKYKIATLGIVQTQKEVLPKIKARTSA